MAATDAVASPAKAAAATDATFCNPGMTRFSSVADAATPAALKAVLTCSAALWARLETLGPSEDMPDATAETNPPPPSVPAVENTPLTDASAPETLEPMDWPRLATLEPMPPPNPSPALSPAADMAADALEPKPSTLFDAPSVPDLTPCSSALPALSPADCAAFLTLPSKPESSSSRPISIFPSAMRPP